MERAGQDVVERAHWSRKADSGVPETGSKLLIEFMAERLRMSSSWTGTEPPTSPVLPPWGTTAMLLSSQYLSCRRANDVGKGDGLARRHRRRVRHPTEVCDRCPPPPPSLRARDERCSLTDAPPLISAGGTAAAATSECAETGQVRPKSRERMWKAATHDSSDFLRRLGLDDDATLALVLAHPVLVVDVELLLLDRLDALGRDRADDLARRADELGERLEGGRRDFGVRLPSRDM